MFKTKLLPVEAAMEKPTPPFDCAVFERRLLPLEPAKSSKPSPVLLTAVFLRRVLLVESVSKKPTTTSAFAVL